MNRRNSQQLIYWKLQGIYHHCVLNTRKSSNKFRDLPVNVEFAGMKTRNWQCVNSYKLSFIFWHMFVLYSLEFSKEINWVSQIFTVKRYRIKSYLLFAAVFRESLLTLEPRAGSRTDTTANLLNLWMKILLLAHSIRLSCRTFYFLAHVCSLQPGVFERN